MPLCINVGLSRKASRDYQSTGVSINVTAELDAALLARPEALQEQIAGLYQQAQLAMERQVQQSALPPRAAANGHAHTPITPSQRRAIIALCQHHQLGPQDQALGQFQRRLEQLSVRQASQLIDHLKGLPDPQVVG
jgi:hypothetical protein